MKLNSRTTSQNKQKGVAVIMALTFVAIISVVAAQMVERLQLHMARSGNYVGLKQAYWYALSAETLAKQLIKDAGRKGKDGMFHLGQDWAKEGMTFPVEGGTISGEIKDLQACFNLNSVRDPNSVGNNNGKNGKGGNQGNKGGNQGNNGGKNGSGNNNGGNNGNNPNANPANAPVEQFRRLLDALSIRSDVSTEALAYRVYDWLDEDSIYKNPQSLEEDDYAGKEFPYLAANTFFASVSELRLIDGFTPNVIDAIKDYVCVLPKVETNILNVNTIAKDQPELLAAMIDGLDSGSAGEILAERPEDGFKAIEEFWQSSGFSGVSNIDSSVKSQFAVKTEYFRLVAKATYDKSEFYLTSTLKVDSESRVSVVQRKFGGQL